MNRAVTIDGEGYLAPRVFRTPSPAAEASAGRRSNPGNEAVCFFWHEMALYLGPSLASSPHGNFCVELTLALDGELGVSLAAGGGVDGLGGALFGSNVPHHHRLRGSRVAQIVVGPLTAPGLGLRASLGKRSVAFIRPSQVEPLRPLLRRLTGCDDVGTAHVVARAVVDHFSNLAPVPAADPRVLHAMTRLLGDFATNTPVADYAREAGLSESRFSHLFRGNAGVPMRTYRRWLRLRAATIFGLTGWDLSDAAHEAGFADQADFSRACREAFGAPPSVITQHPTSVWVGEPPPDCALMQTVAATAAGRARSALTASIRQDTPGQRRLPRSSRP